jgi:hypothetical protein
MLESFVELERVLERLGNYQSVVSYYCGRKKLVKNTCIHIDVHVEKAWLRWSRCLSDWRTNRAWYPRLWY